MPTILYAEDLYPDESVERDVYGPDVRIVWRNVENVADLAAADCADVDGLMVLRHRITAADYAKFPRLRCVVRMGVGTDRIDRAAAAERGVMICNIPDYGTMEVADHAVALALAFRRGIILHHELQRHARRRSASASCSSIPTVRTARTARWESAARRRWRNCCASRTC